MKRQRNAPHDAPGFGRIGFHNEFHAEVIAFFRKHLIKAAKP